MFSYLFGSSKNADTQQQAADQRPENDNPELAMRDALDAHGEFPVDVDGTMNFKDFMILRSIIMRQSHRQFQPTKLKYKEEQLELYKKKDMSQYSMNFAKIQKEYTDTLAFITKKACEWIEFDLKNFNNTVQSILKDKEKTNEMAKLDADQRDSFMEETTELTITKEKALEIYKYRIKEEMNINRRISQMAFTSNEQTRQ